MSVARAWGIGVGAWLMAGCPTVEPPEFDPSGDDTTTGPSTMNTITATTIPLPGDTGSSGTGSTSGMGSSDEGSTSVATTDDSGTSTGSGDTTTVGETTTTGDMTTTGTGAVYDVEWCRLQWPPMVTVAPGESFTVYVRFYVPGLTDTSNGNDPAPELVVEMGYGLDGSDPSTGMGAPWTYVPGMPNPGWNDAAEPNNDEYQGDVSIGMAGIYDYAARISGDGGMTWVYCDLDDLITGGYTPDQAGHAQVG